MSTINSLLNNGDTMNQQQLSMGMQPPLSTFLSLDLIPLNYRSYQHKTIQFVNCHVYRKNEYSVEINYLVKKTFVTHLFFNSICNEIVRNEIYHITSNEAFTTTDAQEHRSPAVN